MQSISRSSFHFIQYPQTPLLEPDYRDPEIRNEKKIVALDEKKAFEIFKQQNRALNFFAATITETGVSFQDYGKQFSIRTILFRPYAKVSQTIVLPFLETMEEGGKIGVAFCALNDQECGKVHFLKSLTSASYIEGIGVEHQTHSQKVIQILNESGIERRSIESDDINKYERDSFSGTFELGALKLSIKITKIIQMRLDQNAALGDEAVAYIAHMKTKKTRVEASKYLAEKNFILLDVTKSLSPSASYRSVNESAIKILNYLSNIFLSSRDTKTILLKALEIIREDFGKELKKRRMKVVYAAIAIGASYFFKDYFFKKFAEG
jgi:hypothetical protein